MKAIILFLVLVSVVNAGPSKQAESDSLEVAHRELQRLTGLDEKAQYERLVCEFWFYESVDDPTNFARLNEDEKKALKKIVGGRPYFLHRYTPKKKGAEVFEVLIGEDGKTVLGVQKKPNQALQHNDHVCQDPCGARLAPAMIVADL